MTQAKMILSLVICTLALVFTSITQADDTEIARAEAEKLLILLGLESSLDQTIEQLLQVQLQQNPTLAPYKDVMTRFFSKYMSFERLKPEIIQLYVDVFNVQELKDLNAFYQTPTGIKMARLLPELAGKSAQIGANLIQENIGELQHMIQEEAERLHGLQESDLESQ